MFNKNEMNEMFNKDEMNEMFNRNETRSGRDGGGSNEKEVDKPEDENRDNEDNVSDAERNEVERRGGRSENVTKGTKRGRSEERGGDSDRKKKNKNKAK